MIQLKLLTSQGGQSHKEKYELHEQSERGGEDRLVLTRSTEPEGSSLPV